MIGAGLVYVAASRNNTPATDTSAIQPVPVVVAKADVPARTALTQEMLDVKLLPPDAISPLAFTNVSTTVGQVTRFPLTTGEQVLTSKVVNVNRGISRSLSFVIPEGKRGFAITASSVQNAGGLLLPGDYVDIIVMHDVQFGENTEGSYLVQTLMQNVEILAVAQTVVDVVEVPVEAEAAEGGAATTQGAAPAAEGDPVDGSTQRVRNTEAAANPEAATVTVAVTPEEAELLYLAEANGRIRLALRPFGDDETIPIDYQTKNELIPQDVPNPFLR